MVKKRTSSRCPLLKNKQIDGLVVDLPTAFYLSAVEVPNGIIRRASTFNTSRLDGIYSDPHSLKHNLHLHYGDAVKVDPLYRYTWTRIPHFYNTPYYVYQYATCFASSAQLFREMTTGPAESRAAAKERYLTLLRSGGNDHPMNQLRKAGVDLTQRATVQAVVDQLDALVTQMEIEAARIQP